MICADINHSSKDTSAVSRWLLWSADGLGSDGQAFKLAQLIESNFSRHKEIQLKTYRNNAELCVQLDLFLSPCLTNALCTQPNEISCKWQGTGLTSLVDATGYDLRQM